MTDPLAARHDPAADTAADLAAEGFDDAREIGRGGFGVVYRCRQNSLDRTVAIKIMTSDIGDATRDRFLREQRAMGKVSGHPNIVEILQTGVTRSGRPYIVMPYHPHSSLEARVRTHGPVSWQEALRIGVKMAGALESAHRLGMLHRDVKPANILSTEYGEPQLCDFGIARVRGGFETRQGDIAGSPAFTAPEVLRGKSPTALADVYSLGATLFCIITGHAAFERRSGEKIVSQFLRITTEPIPDLRKEGIPDSLSSAIEKAMAEDPADRFGSAAEFGRELRTIELNQGLEVDSMALPVAPDEGLESASPEASPATQIATNSPRRRTSTTTTTPPTAATKYRPPTPTHTLVPRTHVLELLRGGGRRRLTLIHAPPGFGKTTVAAQWRNMLIDEGVPVSWLSIDRDDDNVVWFLDHLVESIRCAAPSLARDLCQTLDDHGDEAERYVLTSLINEIHEQRLHLVVMIDDWHVVRDPATIGALRFLLENSCHHLQVVVTSRTKSAVPLGTMRVRDELVEIDASTLRFDTEESQTLLAELGGPALSKQDVARLAATTDGWVAALQLVGVSLRDRDDPSALIGGMTGRHHAIGQYLAENVVSGLDGDLLDFILAISVSDRVCAGLAAALTGVPRPQVLLEEVEERDLFLHALDDDREWFRFDTLFAEFLRRRLERDRPGRVEELHRIAARWFAEHRFHRDAVDHAVAARDDELAASLVEAQTAYLLEHSRMTDLLGLVSKLSPAVVATRPRLQLALAWANVLLQRSAPARTALDTLDSLLEATPQDPKIERIRIEADVARAVVEIAADRVEGVDDLIAKALAEPNSVRPWVVSVAANVSSFASIVRFDFAQARRRQDWAAGVHQRTPGSFGLVYGHCFAGIAATEQLDIAAAEDHFRIALQTAETTSGEQSHSARLASAMLGALLYELGDIDQAEQLLDSGYELGPEGGAVDFMIARYVTGARIKALRGDLDAAVEHLEDGLETAEALALPRLRARIENERFRLDLPHPSRSRPRHGTDRTPPPQAGPSEIVEQLEEATEVRVLLRSDPEAACRRAGNRVALIDEHRRPLAHLQAKRLLAACQVAAGRTEDAKSTVAALASVCAQIGFTRYVVDGGPAVVDVLAQLHADARAHAWSPDWAFVPMSYLAEALQLVDKI
ncbi:MAG: protein kinase [Rhodococcus sp.]|nr:protein kinase [Rhodococcus sp. (in: high G+C Gram-positive bacteria)]